MSLLSVLSNRWRSLSRESRFAALLVAANLLLWLRIPTLFAGFLPAVAVILGFALLLILPGYLLTAIITQDLHMSRSRLALSFALSCGLWSAPAVLLLLVGGNLRMMEWVAVGVIFALSLVVANRAWRQQLRWPDMPHSVRVTLRNLLRHPYEMLFWATLGIMLMITVNSASIWRPSDRWTYVAQIRYYMDTAVLNNVGSIPGHTISPRLELAAWLIDLALVNRWSGVDLQAMYSLYIPPLLLILALCAAYGLAKTVLHTRSGAALTSALLVLYWLADITLPSMAAFNWQERMLWRLDGGQSTLGQWALLGRIVEDKFLLLFVLLPVAQTLLVRTVSKGGRRNWWLLTIVFVGLVFVHPLGVAFFGLSFLVFGIIHLLRQRNWAASRRLAFIIAMIVIGAFVPFTQRTNQMEAAPNVDVWSIDAQAFVEMMPIEVGLWTTPYTDAIFSAHPNYILRRSLLVVAMVLLPLWLWRRRLRTIGDQLLFGVIITILFVTFNPLLAPLLAKIITFRMLVRTYWLLVLPALILLAALGGDLTAWLRLRLALWPRLARWTTLAPILALLLFALVLRSNIAAGLHLLGEIKAAGVSSDEAAVLDYLRANAEPDSRILADAWLSNEIPGYVGQSYPVAFRGMSLLPGSAPKVNQFYGVPWVDAARLDTLRRYRVDYAIAPLDSGIDAQLAELGPTIHEVYANEHYRIYIVSQRWSDNPLLSALEAAQWHFQRQNWPEALEAAQRALEIAPESVGAHQQLAAIYAAQGNYAAAIEAAQVLRGSFFIVPWADQYCATLYTAQANLLALQGAAGTALETHRHAFTLDASNRQAQLGVVQTLLPIYTADVNRTLERARSDAENDSLHERVQANTTVISDTLAALIANAGPQPDRTAIQRRQALYDLANVYAQFGRNDDAVAAYQQAIDLSRSHESEAFLHLGQFYAERGDTAEAERAYLAGLKRDANSRAIYGALADLYTQEGRREAYLELYWQAIRNNPLAAWPRLDLGLRNLERWSRSSGN